jgi:hypothetical protein
MPIPETATNVHQAIKVCQHPNWEKIWTLMNYFASGESQGQWSRVEPIAVLSEVYFMLAQIDSARKKVLEKECQTTN